MYKNKILLLIIIGFIAFQFISQDDQELGEKEGQVATKKTKIKKLLAIANSYKDVSYKAGGTTKNGMDCSGLVNTSFRQIGVKLPRSSKAISTKGKEIPLVDVRLGDLLFFDIARLKGGINHVGLITSIESGEIFFIHSTTSKGVIISSMNESYWEKEFVLAKRILE